MVSANINFIIWAASSEFVSLSIPSWQILNVHAQPFRGAKDLAFCLKVPLDSLLVWVSSGGSGETARMRRLTWTFAARIGDKYQIRLMRPILYISEQTNAKLTKYIHITHNFLTLNFSDDVIYVIVEKKTFPNSWNCRKKLVSIEKKNPHPTGTYSSL